jgi:hypothetical protein
MRGVPSEAPLGDRVARVGDNARARRQCQVLVIIRDVRLCLDASGSDAFDHRSAAAVAYYRDDPEPAITA